MVFSSAIFLYVFFPAVFLVVDSYKPCVLFVWAAAVYSFAAFFCVLELCGRAAALQRPVPQMRQDRDGGSHRA